MRNLSILIVFENVLKSEELIHFEGLKPIMLSIYLFIYLLRTIISM